MIFLIVSLIVVVCESQVPLATYRYDEKLDIECLPHGKNVSSALWSKDHAPHCVEKSQTIEFSYGKDSVYQCLFSFTKEDIEWVSDILEAKKNWNCRVKLTPGHDFYVPFTIGLWGLIEGDHIHLTNHINFVVHAFRGTIMGISSYPIRDQFSYIPKTGGSVAIHGHIHWFSGPGFTNLNMVSTPFSGGISSSGLALTVLVWSLFSFVLGAVIFSIIFFYFLKPKYDKGRKID